MKLSRPLAIPAARLQTALSNALERAGRGELFIIHHYNKPLCVLGPLELLNLADAEPAVEPQVEVIADGAATP